LRHSSMALGMLSFTHIMLYSYHYCQCWGRNATVLDPKPYI